jgi:hypothetical protein
MISRVKRLHLPTFQQVLEDLGNPGAETLARALGVHPRTVRRWTAADAAPRSTLLAL